MSNRQNQWFVPEQDIAREVITADIQRYLGPDALVKPGTGTGENEGVRGYWITAYRTLTTQMIQDLQLDSRRWRAESGRGSPQSQDCKVSRVPNVATVAYKDSRTHESRQYYGPTQPASTPVEYPQSREPPRQAYPQPSSHYPPGEHYTHAPPQSQYPPQQPAYTQYPPRTTQPPQYGGYAQPPQRESPYQATSDPAYSYYQQQPASEPPRQPPVYAQAPSAARPGYYIASDGREYPLSAQPQATPQAPNSGRRRG
ncbi:hypothetical protein GQ43DRAFT_435222 [Delitschia confertaspora ATCC 74209]|uniref:Uncharacterized protein n=1 Tax=Delitschia confertaspora ATCC 74209 TaxID=1513339 RepID=A0A9P4JDB8_9PLEO|nr:hypothetical protein GQ43DRAFT_435222 [Delitschia confertaspora ATCC 74209]